MTYRIIVEDDGHEDTKIVFGHTPEEVKEIKAMPAILSIMKFMEHQMALADRCFKINYPHLAQMSNEGQDRVVKDFHDKVTLQNHQEPKSYNALKIIT